MRRVARLVNTTATDLPTLIPLAGSALVSTSAEESTTIAIIEGASGTIFLTINPPSTALTSSNTGDSQSSSATSLGQQSTASLGALLTSDSASRQFPLTTIP